MDPLQLLGALVVLLATLCLGTIVHECAHAAALRAFGIDCEITWLPSRDAVGVLRASLLGTWASVQPRALSADDPPVGLRIAALMPLTLAAPYLLIPIGAVPDPLATDNPYVIAAAIAWLGCALPSPQDFSVVWYAERMLADECATDGA